MRRALVPAFPLLAALTGLAALAASAPGVAADTVEVRCLPLQYRDGAEAYRNCVTEGRAAAVPSALDVLPFDDRYAIERACAGAAEPRGCVEAELAALEGAPTPFLGALDAGDRHALHRQCFDVQDGDGVASYRRCLDDALGELEGLPEPGLDTLPRAERDALALRCANAESTASGYRGCLLAALDTVPDDVSTADPDTDDATAALSRESPEASPVGSPAETREGLAGDAVEPDETPADAPPTAPSAAAPDALSADPDRASDDVPPGALPEATREASETLAAGTDDAIGEVSPAEPSATTRAAAPAVGAAGPQDTGPTDGTGADDAGTDALGDEEEASAPDLRRQAIDARERLVTTVADLDGTERIVLAAALALPLLLLAFWAATRGARTRRAEHGYAPPPRNAALAERVSTAPSWDDTGDLHADFLDGVDDDFLGDIGDVGADPAPSAELERDRSAFVALDRALDGDDPDLDSDGDDADGRAATPAPPGETVRSSFGHWLLAEEASLRRRHAIEFLVYWMAYGDERYEPQMREALLRSGGDDGDPHASIKRWVLEEDTLAFADAVRWLQDNASELERTQIIDLLMVLLVGEEAMTPVQNTLLHFLADAFGLGPDGLSERHEEAFGRPMPTLARADLVIWWTRVAPESLSLWDARAVAALGERDQHRVRLGLPLDGELDDADIIAAFRRAARRCQPHRFDALGERERALAERQFAKFEEARDRLLGISA